MRQTYCLSLACSCCATMCDATLSKFTNSIFNHLQKRNILKNDRKWKIDKSLLDGRGLFAVDDIQPNEVIFIDHPIIVGPRASKNIKLLCVVCFSNVNPIRVCPKNCGLPICENCTNSSKHEEECKFIQQKLLEDVKLDEISDDLFRSLTPLRSLFIDEESKELIHSLVGHYEDKRHGIELELMKKFISLKPDEENLINVTCSVFDANAFETVVYKNDNITSLRGLYPLSSIMNHNCVPNTTHCFDNEQNMFVKATRLIEKGEELFAIYTTPFWSTQLRRHLLAATKHFWCRCDRCADPEEFGTRLGALKCVDNNCSGVILPIEPLKITSKWKCIVCGNCISSHTMGIVQSAIGSLLVSVSTNDPEQLISLINERLKNIVPESNHITIELKLKANWMLGHKDKFKWEGYIYFTRFFGIPIPEIDSLLSRSVFGTTIFQGKNL